MSPHLYPIRLAKCRQASSRWVWKLACRAMPPHSGQTWGALCLWILWWADTAHGLGSIMGGEHCVHVWKRTEKKQSPPQHLVKAGVSYKKTQKTHRVRSTSDLLEVGDQFSLGGELCLALWTFEVVVLQPLGLLARQRHQCLGALRCTANRSRLRCCCSWSILHWTGVGRDGGAPGRGRRRGDWRRGGRRGEQAWSATSGNQKRQMGHGQWRWITNKWCVLLIKYYQTNLSFRFLCASLQKE